MTVNPQISSAPVSEPAPLASGRAVFWIAWFSFREMVRRRRLISLSLISLLPVLAVLAIRIWYQDQGLTPHQQLAILSFDAYLLFLVPIVAMAVGVSAIGEQVEDGTIVYSWLRPIRRRSIYLGRLLAAQLASSVLLASSLVLCFLVMISEGLDTITWEFLKLYLQTLMIIILGTFTYAALFAAMGTWFRKPVFPAIIFTFGWETLVSNIPARVQEFCLRFHLRNLMERPPEASKDLAGMLKELLNRTIQREPVPPWESMAVLLLVMAVSAVIGIWLLRSKEIEK